MVAQVDTTSQMPTLALQGVVQVVTGPGRTFCASVMAQALRVAGQGTPVLLVQFLKGGIGQGPDNPMMLCQGLRWVRCNLGRCIDTPQLSAEEQQALLDLWKYTRKAVHSGRYALVVLDELSLAVHFGLIPEAEVLELLTNRPSYVDVILTGPQMPAAVLDLADLVTEERKPLHRA